MTGWKIGGSRVTRLGLGAAMVASVLGMSAPASSAAAVRRPIAVVAKSFQFLGVPGRLPAGQYDVRFFNISRDDDHEFVAFNLGPICSPGTRTAADGKALFERIGAAAEGGTEDDFGRAFDDACPGNSFAGAVFAPPGGRDRADLDLQPGKTLYLCFIPEDGVPHFELGMIGLIDVFSLPTR